MEGITDEAFRKTILKLYPEWDYLATDFLRVPSAGRYPAKHIVRLCRRLGTFCQRLRKAGRARDDERFGADAKL